MLQVLVIKANGDDRSIACLCPAVTSRR